MDDTEFHAEQMAQFSAFVAELGRIVKSLETQNPESGSEEDPGPEGRPMDALLEQFENLAAHPERVMDEGPGLVGRLFTTAPGFAQNFPRDLLWYLGGECLHFMPDEEIEGYSALDDQRRDAAARGEAFAWREARAAHLKLQ